MAEKTKKSERDWKTELTPEQYRITRQKGTERAFTGEYWDNKEEGIYLCVCCGEPLFSSDTKYESGTGWPSFWRPMDPDSIREEEDNSWIMTRTEIVCSNCDAHLGHLFPDGPQPTGMRFCVNSAALSFEKKEESSE